MTFEEHIERMQATRKAQLHAWDRLMSILYEKNYHHADYTGACEARENAIREFVADWAKREF